MSESTGHHAQSSEHHHSKNWYDRYYKVMLIVPIALLVLSLLYLVQFNAREGDLIYKDVTLTGGTTITVFDDKVNLDDIEIALKSKFPDVVVKGISDIQTGKQHAFYVESKADAPELRSAMEEYLKYKLTNENSSTEFSGSTLSSGFYQQLRNAMLTAFMLMAWVVFFIFSDSRKINAFATILTFLGVKILLGGIPFVSAMSLVGIFAGLIYGIMQKNKTRNDYILLIGSGAAGILAWFMYPAGVLLIPIGIVLVGIYTITSLPSIAVILCAFADIVMTVTFVNILGIQLSSAGIVAFLMLIGYSVDTDILLTTRLLRNQEGNVNHRIWGAYKTGMTMTLAAIASVGVSFVIIYQFSDTLRQIFGIILIGLVFDILNTWVTNASILKWYMEVKKIA